MPITRSQIIQCKFIVYFLTVILGAILTLGFSTLSSLRADSFELRNAYSIILSSMGTTLCAGAFFFPIVYVFKADKGGETYMMLSFLTSSGLFVMFLQVIRKIAPTTEFIYSATCFVAVAIIMYTIAYVITAKLYRKHELLY